MTAVVVVEGTPAHREQALDDAVQVGWALVDGWPRHPAPAPGTLVVVPVRNELDATAAVLAAAQGHSMLVHAMADPATIARLCDDLRHVGAFAHRVGGADPVMDRTDRALVAALAAGATLAGAATRAHVSRRTADRRIAALRIRAGVPSLAALLVAHRDRLAGVPAPDQVARFPDA